MMRSISSVLCVLAAASTLSAQDWKPELRNIYQSVSFDGFEVNAPRGYRILDAPSPTAKVIREVSGPAKVLVTNYVERGTERFYLDSANRDKTWDNIAPEWIHIPGTGRAEFIAATQPATLLKKETRDFFKEGPVTAEIFAETVTLQPLTTWGPDFRIAEIDFLMPVKVAGFQPLPSGGWELSLTVYPAFDSNIDRIPGPQPELYGEPYRALITTSARNEVKVAGSSNSDKLSSVFLPDTVWVAAISEGRVQSLRLGYTDLPPSIAVSKLSPPLFTKTDPMSFRFQATRLLSDPAMISVTPDKVVGVDYTHYEALADIGGPYENDEDADLWIYMQGQWNIGVDSRGRVDVVAPLAEGRGAAGMLELESLSLGPSYEEELKALVDFAKQETPSTPAPESPQWHSALENKIGAVPASQRIPETMPF